MANRIKGITVEIGVDTTKLSKALEGVNKSIKNTQTQLKDVEKLLKLDPRNTELLSQKQKLLADSISATKEKLATLKTAAEQANTALANGEIIQQQYDTLQREIIEIKVKNTIEKTKERFGRSFIFVNLNLTHTLLKSKYTLIAVTDKIVRCIGHRVFLIEKLCNMKSANIYIKVNVTLVKVGCAGFPYLCIRIHLLQFKPDLFADAFTLNAILYKQQIKMVMLCFFIDDNNSTAHNFTVNNGFICSSTFRIQ